MKVRIGQEEFWPFYYQTDDADPSYPEIELSPEDYEDWQSGTKK